MSTTAGAAHVDSVANAHVDTGQSTYGMVGTTVTGNDAIVQFISDGPTGISSPYTAFTSAHFGYAYALDITDGTAPTWTSGGLSPAAGSAVAWAPGIGSGATPTFLPPGGSYSVAQTVAISSTSVGAIICWNTTGAPATDGATGCTNGAVYTTPVSVPNSETLYAVAGGAGYTDSVVGWAAYTISNTPPGTIQSPGTKRTTGTVIQ